MEASWCIRALLGHFGPFHSRHDETGPFWAAATNANRSVQILSTMIYKQQAGSSTEADKEKYLEKSHWAPEPGKIFFTYGQVDTLTTNMNELIRKKYLNPMTKPSKSELIGTYRYWMRGKHHQHGKMKTLSVKVS